LYKILLAYLNNPNILDLEIEIEKESFE